MNSYQDESRTQLIMKTPPFCFYSLENALPVSSSDTQGLQLAGKDEGK